MPKTFSTYSLTSGGQWEFIEQFDDHLEALNSLLVSWPANTRDAAIAEDKGPVVAEFLRLAGDPALCLVVGWGRPTLYFIQYVTNPETGKRTTHVDEVKDHADLIAYQETRGDEHIV
jgi:hypothetical protein